MFLELILIILFLYAQTAAHEDAHKQIMLYHGCENVTTDVNWDFSGSAKCEDSRQISDQEVFLHSLNEIIGYQADMITAMILILFCLLSISFYISRSY